MGIGELTSAKTAPNLITLPTDLSIDAVISGEYSFSNPSSSRSEKRRAPAYADILSGRGWGVAKVRTVAFVENRNCREPLYFPMTIVSVLLYQICADSLVMRLTQYGELVAVRAPVTIE